MLRNLRSSKRSMSTFMDKFDSYFLGQDPVKDGHSKLLAKPQFIYNIETHDIRPGRMTEFLQNAKDTLPLVHESPEIPTTLYGQFVVKYGQTDRVFTIWKHTGSYPSLDETATLLKSHKAYQEYELSQVELVRKRNQQLCYEFSFWPEYKDDYDGGIFEFRTYRLKPGCLYEWGNSWASVINHRKDSAVMGMCSQIGQMYTVHHIWRYRDLEHRREQRNKAWESGQWADLVVRTGTYILILLG
eukprot:sb/3468979/